MSNDLNRTEQTLTMVLGILAANAAHAIMSSHDYPEPTDEQAREMARRQTSAVLHLVVGLRQDGDPPTGDEVAALVTGLAEGAVLAVLGQPPDRRASMN